MEISNGLSWKKIATVVWENVKIFNNKHFCGLCTLMCWAWVRHCWIPILLSNRQLVESPIKVWVKSHIEWRQMELIALERFPTQILKYFVMLLLSKVKTCMLETERAYTVRKRVWKKSKIYKLRIHNVKVQTLSISLWSPYMCEVLSHYQCVWSPHIHVYMFAKSAGSSK